MKQHWAKINENTFVLGIKILFKIESIFGRKIVKIFLYPVIFWYVLVNKTARQASKDYLKQVYNFSQDEQLYPKLYNVFKHFSYFGESILDKLIIWKGNYPLNEVIIYGREQFQPFLKKKQGCLIICSHLGNIELCKILSKTKSNLKTTMLVHTKHSKAFNKLLDELSPENKFSLMQVSEISADMIITLKQRIDNGDFVIIAGDRVPVSSSQRTVKVDFLGKKAKFPVGPYLLAALLGTPCFLMFSTKANQKDNVYVELFREKIEIPNKKLREELFTNLAADYAKRLEKYCLINPWLWFNFYPFWD